MIGSVGDDFKKEHLRPLFCEGFLQQLTIAWHSSEESAKTCWIPIWSADLDRSPTKQIGLKSQFPLNDEWYLTKP